MDEIAKLPISSKRLLSTGVLNIELPRLVTCVYVCVRARAWVHACVCALSDYRNFNIFSK